MCIYVCMAGSLCCSSESVTTLLIGYTPIQNKKLKKCWIENKKVCTIFGVLRKWGNTYNNTLLVSLDLGETILS